MSEADILRGIIKLRDRYTQNREDLASETLDESLVSCYTLFYMTTNMEKFPFVLRKLLPEIREKILKSTIIDFGCGPGTFAWGLSQHYQNDFHHYHGIDRDPLMLRAAEKLRDLLLQRQSSISFSYTIDEMKNYTGEKTLVFSHSMNEIEQSLVKMIIEKVNPTYLIFIEPGTSAVFASLMNWRMEQDKYIPVYPCASNNLACPIFANEESEDWCHQIIRQSLDPHLERFAQMAKIDRRTQTMIAHLYLRKENSTQLVVNRAVILRFIKETKFSYLYQICEGNKQIKIEILKKDVKGRKDLATVLSAGQFIEYEIIKKISSDYVRVKLTIKEA